jgi:hypothetical protein
VTRAHVAVAVLALSVVMLAAAIGGPPGLAYLLLYAAATLPGLPIGRRLLGTSPAGLVAGALLGYGITALCIWLPVAAGHPSATAFALLWLIACAGSWRLVRRGAPLVELPPWTQGTTAALCGVALLVPMLTARPFLRIGDVDAAGNTRYRAYFTADFVWHEALTAEIARFSFPPRNPYMAIRPLNYYWAYYLLPASATSVVKGSPPIEHFLAINALGTGVLLVSAMFVSAWAAFPRAWAVAAGVGLTVVASSAEGLYALVRLANRGAALSGVRDLNIDAISAWWFSALSIDGLPRSIWWNPQHSIACALGLVALTIAARGGAAMGWRAAAGAGTALGLALIMSPFPGGAMILIYAVSLLWSVASRPAGIWRLFVEQAAAVVPVAAALGWDVFNRTFEGAGSAVAIGLSQAARNSLGWPLLIALGPVLVPIALGAVAATLRGWWPPMRPVIAGVTVAIMLMFLVTLTLEPIWIGWRAGQVLLVACPALVAAALASLHELSGRLATAAVMVVLLAVGLPTTVIDAYNAQDTSNLDMGAGFHWTIVITPQEQEALRWIERSTPADALVQMSLNPRGRETWSLIPSFARRRMAAGLPISLLRTPVYEERAARVDTIFSSGNAAEASRIAREFRVDYLYVGRVEREAFGQALAALDAHPDLFAVAFRNAESTVYAVK